MTNADTFAPGTLLAGKFRIIQRLGEGGMGSVYEIEHEITKHRRALKMLHSQMAALPSIVERFLREASAAGRVGNPHIAETFDAGRLDTGEPYLVMELLRGEPLSSRIARGRLLVHEVVDLIGQAAVGVAAAHAAGIVHRDLKPDNLFVVDIDGRPFIKILDFGISKFDQATTGGMALTKEGAAMGTPYYMSPEQIRGLSNLDARADVYALGVILYECLSGKRPFESDVLTHLAILIHAGECEPIERLRQDLPPGFAELVRQAMASDRDKRIATAAELRSKLERYGQISFRTQTSLSSLPPPSMAPARSVAMATSGVGVSMQTPPPVPGSKRGLLLGGLAAVGVVLIGGALLALRSPSSPAAGAAPSSTGVDAATAVKAEPTPPHAESAEPPAPVAIATEKAEPPPAAPSAAQSAVPTLRSAPIPASPNRPGRAEQRGLAKDNPFK
ncbi:MAG TPA: protein kinase [Polyangiaceae bacterium]|nr:protein kinase [Polyangiaceae bacterium]